MPDNIDIKKMTTTNYYYYLSSHKLFIHYKCKKTWFSLSRWSCTINLFALVWCFLHHLISGSISSAHAWLNNRRDVVCRRGPWTFVDPDVSWVIQHTTSPNYCMNDFQSSQVAMTVDTSFSLKLSLDLMLLSIHIREPQNSLYYATKPHPR